MDPISGSRSRAHAIEAQVSPNVFIHCMYTILKTLAVIQPGNRTCTQIGADTKAYCCAVSYRGHN